MPGAPITIGELTNVPTFDSPINSPWSQDVSRRVVHRFTTTGERDAKYPAATAGAGAVCAVGAVEYMSDGTIWRPVGVDALVVAELDYTPTANTPLGSVSPVQLLTLGNVTVPVWAKRAKFALGVGCMINSSATGSLQFWFAPKIGATPTPNIIRDGCGGKVDRFSYYLNGTIASLVATGVQAVTLWGQIMYSNPLGGSVVLDTASIILLTLTFLP